MTLNNIRIIIVPDHVELSRLRSCAKEEVGSIFSTPGMLNANRISDGYSVLYRASDFMIRSPEEIASGAVEMFMKNLPNSKFHLSCFYHYTDKDGNSHLNVDVAKAFVKLASALQMQGLRYPKDVFYQASTSVQAVADILTKVSLPNSIYYPTSNHTSNTDSAEADDAFTDFVGDYEINSPLNSIMHSIRGLLHDTDDEDEYDDEYDEDDDGYDDDDDEDEYEYSRRRERQDHYTHSRIMSHSANPKKEFRRHGVLIVDDKDDVERDRHTIKKFLKDFIPGNEGWKKEFRRELLDRWMSTYAIRKKRLRKLEKEWKDQQKTPIKEIGRELFSGLSHRVIQMKYDPHWNDPTK